MYSPFIAFFTTNSMQVIDRNTFDQITKRGVLWTAASECIYTHEKEEQDVPDTIPTTQRLPGSAGRNTRIAVAKKRKKKKPRKDAQLVLRLNSQLRDRFVDACEDLDTSAAREVRRFIKRFLKRYDKGELDD